MKKEDIDWLLEDPKRQKYFDKLIDKCVDMYKYLLGKELFKKMKNMPKKELEELINK